MATERIIPGEIRIFLNVIEHFKSKVSYGRTFFSSGVIMNDFYY